MRGKVEQQRQHRKKNKTYGQVQILRLFRDLCAVVVGIKPAVLIDYMCIEESVIEAGLEVVLRHPHQWKGHVEEDQEQQMCCRETVTTAVPPVHDGDDAYEDEDNYNIESISHTDTITNLHHEPGNASHDPKIMLVSMDGCLMVMCLDKVIQESAHMPRCIVFDTQPCGHHNTASCTIDADAHKRNMMKHNVVNCPRWATPCEEEHVHSKMRIVLNTVMQYHDEDKGHGDQVLVTRRGAADAAIGATSTASSITAAATAVDTEHIHSKPSTHSSTTASRIPPVLYLDGILKSQALTMPTVNGWLLGYPVTYVVPDEDAATRIQRILSCSTLLVYSIFIMDGEHALKQDNDDRWVLSSFSIPASLTNVDNYDVVNGEALDSATHLDFDIEAWKSFFLQHYWKDIERRNILGWKTLQFQVESIMTGIVL